MTTAADILDALVEKIPSARREGPNWMAFCPAHPDGHTQGRRSLAIREGEKGIVLKCHAGCETPAIVAAMGLKMSDLFYEQTKGGDAQRPPTAPPSSPRATRSAGSEAPAPKPPAPAPPLPPRTQVAEYVYQNEDGQPAYKVVRYDPKGFSQHAWVDGAWASKLGDVQRILYRLPAVKAAVAAGHAIFIAEGEKDVDSLVAAGLVATTTPGGSSALKVESLAPLRNAREVVILPDNDDPGRKYALRVARALKDLNPSIVVRIVTLPVEEKQDVTDFLAQRPVRALQSLVVDSPEWGSGVVPAEGVTLGSFLDYCKVSDNGVPTFQPSRLGSALAGRYGIVPGIDGQLWRYDRGVYIPSGLTLARNEAATVLGEDYRAKRVDEVVAWLRDQVMVAMNGGEDRERLVNVRNGLLDWRAGALAPHTPSHYSTIQLPVSYDPAARCPQIDRFLERFSPGAEFMAELVGLLMIPHTDFRRAFMFYGPSGTGKSTFLDLVRAFLGDTNVSSVSLHKLSDDKFATSGLDGKLANIYPDLDARGVESSATFKTLVGGRDLISAERKFGHPYAYKPTARLLFSANEMPGSRDQTDAWYLRWIVVPFTRKPTEDEYDPKISDKLTTPEELSGLLNRAVAGLARLMDRKAFLLPDEIADAGHEYRAMHDTVKMFADPTEGFLAYRPGGRTTRGNLYDAYVNCCKRNGRHAIPQARFTRRFRDEAGDAITDYQSSGVRGFEGVSVLQN